MSENDRENDRENDGEYQPSSDPVFRGNFETFVSAMFQDLALRAMDDGVFEIFMSSVIKELVAIALETLVDDYPPFSEVIPGSDEELIHRRICGKVSMLILEEVARVSGT